MSGPGTGVLSIDADRLQLALPDGSLTAQPIAPVQLFGRGPPRSWRRCARRRARS